MSQYSMSEAVCQSTTSLNQAPRQTYTSFYQCQDPPLLLAGGETMMKQRRCSPMEKPGVLKQAGVQRVWAATPE